MELDDDAAALRALLEQSAAGVDLARFAANRNVPKEELIARVPMKIAAGLGFAPRAWSALKADALERLAAWHARAPDSAGLPEERLVESPRLARAALEELASTARAGKATPADLSGGTITITNVGVFGVDAGTPILTPGEAAILAFGQVKDAPWVVDGPLAVRKVCPLAMSFDHRIIDGELGSAVLREVGAMLTDPLRMPAWA